MQNVPPHWALFSGTFVAAPVWVPHNNNSNWKAHELPASWKSQRHPLFSQYYQVVLVVTSLKRSSSAFGVKFCIGVQLGNPPSLTSISFFFFTGTDDATLESWVSVISSFQPFLMFFMYFVQIQVFVVCIIFLLPENFLLKSSVLQPGRNSFYQLLSVGQKFFIVPPFFKKIFSFAKDFWVYSFSTSTLKLMFYYLLVYIIHDKESAVILIFFNLCT